MRYFIYHNTFYQANLVIIADSHTGFCSELLWKHQTSDSYWSCSVKKSVIKNFCKFHRKTPVLKSVFNRVAESQHWSFPVEFVKFLRTPILKNIWERLFLKSVFQRDCPFFNFWLKLVPCFSFSSQFIVSFVNSHFTTIDTI